ncbi:hypothetical protein [Niastella sp. OAS944]|uniref:hypothetical protein n=1 Tax=Niastella sp. OAS944 TaxID=2664089 RepID=UPI003479A87A|nr:membrane protease YdiL (CAAX protease family) [Chitinophagaceae bacterium OAS944]
MKKAYFLIAFLIVLLIALIYFFGSAASVGPGWHTTVYPAYYSWVLVIIMTLFFAVIGYWLYLKTISKLNWILFIIYFLATTSTYFFIKFPAVLLKYRQYNQAMFENARTIIQLLPIATWVLIITQILLVGYIAALVILRKKRVQI